VDYFGGFRPGDNLFGNSVIALDVRTGRRRWHYQTVRHDIWNYDLPVAPVLMDVTVDGRRIPGLFQATKQAFLFAFNRETGEPIWPVEDRPVPASRVPGERLAATQPFPTWPLPYDLQGRNETHIIDSTPELRSRALDLAFKGNHFAPFFNPPVHRGNREGQWAARICPFDIGGVNITGPPAADPVAGVMFITSQSGCGNQLLVPGIERDHDMRTGTTVVEWVPAMGGASVPYPDDAVPQEIDGISIWKGPLGRITAIDLNTGEHLWVIPHGDAPREVQSAIRDHPMLQGLEGVPTNPGRAGHAAMLATPTLLLATGQTSDGVPRLFAIEKSTGKRVGQVQTPGLGQYGIMTYMHEGRQYVVLAVAGGSVAFALP
jgi:glucose dehydrogenase